LRILRRRRVRGRGPHSEADRGETGGAERDGLADDAAAIAEPMVCPRRSAGVSLTSHVSPAVQANALPKPCANRARSSTTIESPIAKTNVLTATKSIPAIAVGRAPILAVVSPPGILPTSAPIG
jgi:hypothetical protein